MRKHYRRKSYLKPYFEDEIYSFTTDGGRVSFYLKQIPYVFSVNIGVWIPGGAVCDPKGKEGMAHLIEHLIFKGTETRTDEEILSAVESKGGQINAYTSQEFTCIQVTILPEHLSETLELISDILHHSTFASLDKEKNVVLEEIALLEDTPEELIDDLFNCFVWGEHPLANPILGTEESIEKITKADLQRFYKKWYQCGKIIVVVVGNIDLRNFERIVKDSFLCYGKKNINPKSIPKPSFRSGVKCHLKDVAQVHFSLGFPAPGIKDNRKYRYVSFVAVSVLGGSSTSKLFYKIREQEGLAYNIYSDYELFGNVGCVQVCGSVSHSNFSKVLALTIEEIKKLREELLSEDILEKYKNEMVGDWLLYQEFATSHLSRIGFSIFYTGEVLSVEEYLTALENIKPIDVCEFFQEFCDPDKLALVYMSPKEYEIEEILKF